MTLTLLDLYKSAASQEWSMYDSDLDSDEELENSLLISINKAVGEILYSYPFGFRERTYIFLTQAKKNGYKMPPGIIRKDEAGRYMIKVNSENVDMLKFLPENSDSVGIPQKFFIKNAKLYFYPVPAEKSIVTVDYITLAIGENKLGEEIYSLSDRDDIINIPEYLEEIFKNAVISRTMLNTIASETDENYSVHKKQSETAYRQLIKYSKGVVADKTIKI